MNKQDYIEAISKAGNRYGDKLLELMDLAGVWNLQEVPEETARQYYEKHIKKEDQYHGL